MGHAIGRTRRRLRAQALVEHLTTFAVPAIAAGATVLYSWRIGWLGPTAAVSAGVAVGLAWVATALVLAMRSPRDVAIAARLDRACGLESRLATACELKDELARTTDPATLELMQLAIQDGARAALRADAAIAAPWHAPRDGRAALAFALIGAAVLVLAVRPPPSGGVGDGVALLNPKHDLEDPAERALAAEDVEYARELARDLARVGAEAGDPELAELSRKIEALLAQAERGELSKDELLAKVDELEKVYRRGVGDPDRAKADLAEVGKKLQKAEATKELGKALEAGDAAKASDELKKLADKLDKGEVPEKDQKQVADAMAEAAKALEQKAKKEKDASDAKRAQEIKKKQDEVRSLERKSKQDPEDKEMARRLEREKRELERLERDKPEDPREEGRRRQLERLSRTLKNSAENLRNRKPRESAEQVRQFEQEQNKIDKEARRMEAERKAQSRLADLKEALRRAKAQKNQGGGQARKQRIQEYLRRAQGQRGRREVWRPGQGKAGQGQQGQGGQGQQGQGQQGQGQGKDGLGQGGNAPGTEHDPDVMGAPTPKNGETKDQQVAGVQGRGPSRRETVLTSAQRGFASTGYKQVFADYQKIVEDVMNQEKVPQGYKYLVKRYFQRIKPQDGETQTP